MYFEPGTFGSVRTDGYVISRHHLFANLENGFVPTPGGGSPNRDKSQPVDDPGDIFSILMLADQDVDVLSPVRISKSEHPPMPESKDHGFIFFPQVI
jgi:hypothetical protein